MFSYPLPFRISAMSYNFEVLTGSHVIDNWIEAVPHQVWYDRKSPEVPLIEPELIELQQEYCHIHLGGHFYTEFYQDERAVIPA
jgi:hypothetical protein